MIRKATIKDIKWVHSVLHEYGRRGELLARPLSQLYDHVRDFSLYVDEAEKGILGCCALQFCWEDLAEIRSLAVDPARQREGIGSRLMQAVLEEAESFNIHKVFALTYKPAFFKRFGFVEIEKSELPLKTWGDCIICVKFPDCDEIAMMKKIG
jgi:amino-acid N-acetyltransferase